MHLLLVQASHFGLQICDAHRVGVVLSLKQAHLSLELDHLGCFSGQLLLGANQAVGQDVGRNVPPRQLLLMRGLHVLDSLPGRLAGSLAQLFRLQGIRARIFHLALQHPGGLGPALELQEPLPLTRRVFFQCPAVAFVDLFQPLLLAFRLVLGLGQLLRMALLHHLPVLFLHVFIVSQDLGLFPFQRPLLFAHLVLCRTLGVLL